jgi:hypothetical protein
MILSEIREESQIQKINAVKSKMTIKEYTPEELLTLWKFQQEIHRSCNLSIQDCSILSYCEEHGYTMLTGDKVLRTKASERNISVRGVIFIFDQLVDNCIIPASIAAERLERLNSINQRLPHKEIESRLIKWRNE